MMIDHDKRFGDRQRLRIQIHRASKSAAVDIDAFDEHQMNDS